MKGFSALIPAAGLGSRLGQGPKVWLELAGRPIFVWVVAKFAALAGEVVVAVPGQDMDRAAALAEQYSLRVRLVEGGDTRQESIRRLVFAAQCEQVLIHDGARPFVTSTLVERVAAAGVKFGAAAAFLPAEVPVARIEAGRVVEHFHSANMALFQSPQSFDRAALLPVLNEAQRTGALRQSILQLWLEAGNEVHTLLGEKTNIKLTTEDDMVLAELFTGYLGR